MFLPRCQDNGVGRSLLCRYLPSQDVLCSCSNNLCMPAHITLAVELLLLLCRLLMEHPEHPPWPPEQHAPGENICKRQRTAPRPQPVWWSNLKLCFSRALWSPIVSDTLVSESSAMNQQQSTWFQCVKQVGEAYTSKTCSECGYLRYNLGGSKVFRCDECASVMDRDVNGAKNIFLKNFEALGLP